MAAAWIGFSSRRGGPGEGRGETQGSAMGDLQHVLLVPLLIFFARVADVSVGTIRIIHVARGRKGTAVALGFIEIFIWLIAMGQIFKNLTNVFCYVGFAAGFATGNYIGMTIEERLAMGTVLVRLITIEDANDLIRALRERGFGATVIEASGASGPVNVIASVVKRADVPEALGLVQKHHPQAFYTLEDLRAVKEGIFPDAGRGEWIRRLFLPIRRFR